MTKNEEMLTKVIWSLFTENFESGKCEEGTNFLPDFDEDEALEMISYGDNEGIIVTNSEISSETIDYVLDAYTSEYHYDDEIESIEESVDEYIELLIEDLEKVYADNGLELSYEGDYGCVNYVIRLNEEYDEVSIDNYNKLCRIGINGLIDLVSTDPKYEKYKGIIE